MWGPLAHAPESTGENLSWLGLRSGDTRYFGCVFGITQTRTRNHIRLDFKLPNYPYVNIIVIQFLKSLCWILCYQIMLLLYYNLISCNLTLLSFIVVFSWKFELCLLPNYIAIVFLRFLATSSSLGGKIRTQRMWASVLFCHPNKLWIWVRMMHSGAGFGSVKPAPVGTRCHPYQQLATTTTPCPSLTTTPISHWVLLHQH
jgi:hypothetical protein